MENESPFKTIKFTITSNYKNVELVSLSVAKICSSLTLTEQNIYDIELCTVEAINNCIEHAYNQQNDKNIEVILTIYPSNIRIQVVDTGIYYNDFKPVTHEFDITNTEDLPEGGFGLSIIFDVMDEVNYLNEGNKNILIMTKNFEE